ncbi:hypothetical protein V6N13_001516 [Hibiscus sabdariffa]|uniref:Uncharacterized protein n=1 Tax=Hibiscus sabdariffa TaxID=183260 RepID=A0ABR2G8J1_9ROSI
MEKGQKSSLTPTCDLPETAGNIPPLLRFYLCKGFNNLLEQDDKGDVSAETTGPAPAEVSAGIQISAERLLCYWLIPKSE